MKKVAVVGAGAFGKNHVRVYSELKNVELVGIADISASRAAEIASPYNIYNTTDYRDLIDRVDAVSIAVPTEHHLEVARAFMAAGKDVLVEKPIADSLGAADEMVAMAERNGLILQVGHLERFNPATQAMLTRIKEPRFIETLRLSPFVPRSLDVDVILDLMIHDIDIILRAAGSVLKEIRAVGVNALTPKIDIANVRLEFESGCVANLTASRISKERVRKFRVFQTNSYLSLDYAEQDAEMYSLKVTGGAPEILKDDCPVEKAEPLKRELESFIDSVMTREAPAVDGKQGRDALEVALKITDIINSQRDNLR